MFKKVFASFLLYNPIWIVFLSQFVSVWLIWLSPISFVSFYLVTKADERAKFKVNNLFELAEWLNLATLVYAIYVTGVAMNIDLWLVITIIVLSLTVLKFWRELVVIIYPDPEIFCYFSIYQLNKKVVLWKAKGDKGLYALERLIKFQSAAIYDMPKIYLAYLQRAVSIHSLVDVKHKVFKIIKHPLFEITTESGEDINTKEEFHYISRVEYVTRLLSSLYYNNVYESHFYLDKLSSIIKDCHWQCFNGSEIFSSYLDFLGKSKLAQTSDSKIVKKMIKEHQEKKRKKQEALKKRLENGEIDAFCEYVKEFSPKKELVRDFYKKLTFSDLKSQEVIRFSSYKKRVIWNSTIDDLFEVTSYILKDEDDDNVLGVVVDTIAEIIVKLLRVGDKNLKQVIEKKANILDNSLNSAFLENKIQAKQRA